jgi:hypothetical protein
MNNHSTGSRDKQADGRAQMISSQAGRLQGCACAVRQTRIRKEELDILGAGRQATPNIHYSSYLLHRILTTPIIVHIGEFRNAGC